MKIRLLLILCLSPLLPAQINIGRGRARTLYDQHCAVCHGKNGNNGMGGSLVAPPFQYGRGDDEMAALIRDGIPDLGMQAFGDTLNEKQIRSLVIFIRELEEIHKNTPPVKPVQGKVDTRLQSYELRELARSPGKMWGHVPLPEGGFLATEIEGKLYQISAEGQRREIAGIPPSVRFGQGGLLDVALHPNYPKEPWIYLTLSGGSDRQLMTELHRGQIQNGQWQNNEVLFRVPANLRSRAGQHFGSRIAFRGDKIFFSIGDRGSQNLAQDLKRPNGKIYRLNLDGSIPEDNPFLQRGLPAIWSWGHRNPQALTLRPGTDELWSTEHGPRGGDELNQIRKGLNYGWPVITHGMNYNGSPITPLQEKEGMESPVFHWTPSIAVCGMAFVHNSSLEAWNGDLLVGGLRSQRIERLRLNAAGEVEDREIILENAGRVRDIRCSPDGRVSVILEGRGSRLVEFVPISKTP